MVQAQLWMKEWNGLTATGITTSQSDPRVRPTMIHRSTALYPVGSMRVEYKPRPSRPFYTAQSSIVGYRVSSRFQGLTHIDPGDYNMMMQLQAYTLDHSIRY